MSEAKDIRYLNKDFNQLRGALIEFSKNYFPNTYSDFNESSPGMMFLEMSAYVGDVLSYYTDNQLKESLLVSAQEAPNLYAIANSLGYSVKNVIPSTVQLDIFQLLPAKNVFNGIGTEPDWSYALSIPAGMIAKSTSTTNEFRTLDIVNFALSSSFDPTEVSVYQINDSTNFPEYYLLKKSVKAVAGQIVEATYDFTDARRFDKINITDANIINVESIIDSDNNIWYEVPHLAQDTIFETVSNVIQNDPDNAVNSGEVPYLLKLRKTNRRFITRFKSTGDLEIQFGSGIAADFDEEIIPNPDNVGSSLPNLQLVYDQPIDPSNFMYTKSYGLAPSNTTLRVRYTVGGGVQSNVPAFDITNILAIQFDIDTTGLSSPLLNQIKNSIACTNPQPAVGGKDNESYEDIRYNALANFASQQRAVTTQDYIIRAYSMPPKFGAIAKAYILQDNQIDPVLNTTIPNPLALNLYCLGYNGNGQLTVLNSTIKENLRTYLSQYRILTDAVNIKDAYIINVKLFFEIITLPEFNSNEVLLKCISTLKDYFDIKKWQINQPIIISKIYTLLDKVDGVQSVTSVRFDNVYQTELGYSGNVYDMETATKNGVIYPSLDPSIFEIKYPNIDIQGKINSF
jgi:hypothetical protein